LGDCVGPNPTDRGQDGPKRSLITDGQGGPLGVAIGGATVNDPKLQEATLEAIVVERPDPAEVEQPFGLDRGDDTPTGHEVVERPGSVGPIRPRGEDRRAKRRPGRRQPRRWVVERTIAWLNQCRALLVRYNKKAQNYLGLIQMACALLWFRRLHRMGAT
jgi:putative transposase